MNYYKILELNRDCTLDDIKKSYKRLCKIHHPDKDTGNHDRFLEISEAYNYLLKNHKNKNSANKIWQELFNERTKVRKHQEVLVIRITPEEAREESNHTVTFFLSAPCSKCSILTRSLCHICKGTGYKKSHVKDTFKLPKLTKQDESFLVENYRHNLDLKIIAHTQAPTGFKSIGRNIESVEEINIFKSIVGGKQLVRTLTGDLEIDLPGNQIRDFNFVLKEKGLYKGDHLIKFKIYLPKSLTNEQKNILTNLIDEKEKVN